MEDQVIEKVLGVTGTVLVWWEPSLREASRNLSGFIIERKHARGGAASEDDILALGIIAVGDDDGRDAILIKLAKGLNVVLVVRIHVARDVELSPLRSASDAIDFGVLPLGLMLPISDHVEIVRFGKTPTSHFILLE